MVTEEVLKYGGTGAVLMEMLRKRGGKTKYVRMSYNDIRKVYKEYSSGRIQASLRKLYKMGVIEKQKVIDDMALYYRIKSTEVDLMNKASKSKE